MDYLDEQILELKRQQKKEKYQSLETGFYIRDELLEFERMLLEPMDLSIMLPATFVTMPQSMVRVKYQSESRPQIIKTSLDTSVNFTFSLVPQEVRPEQLRSLVSQLKAVIQRMNPANTFYDMKEEQTASQIPVCWFDYKGFAIDEQVYYIMFALPWKDKQLIHGTFNCKYSDMNEWKEAARQAILSIEAKEEERV